LANQTLQSKPKAENLGRRILQKISCQEGIFLTQGIVKKTATEAELTMMLEICALNDYRAAIKFISMVPKNIIDVKNGLTPQVLEGYAKTFG